MIRLFLYLMMAMFATTAHANEIAGPAKAVDSTVIEINGQRIMLFGIDSVMRKQRLHSRRQNLAMLGGRGARA
jgi:hypothetical protein